MTAVEPFELPDLDDEESVGRWMVTDDDRASWALRRIGEARSELGRIAHRHQIETQRIDEAARLASGGPQRTIDTMEAKLIEYRLAIEAANPRMAAKRTRYRLLVGSIARRKGSARTVVTDPDALVAWCAEHEPDLVRREVKPSDVLRATIDTLGDEPGTAPLVTVDGEPVPGIERVRGEDTFTVDAEIAEVDA